MVSSHWGRALSAAVSLSVVAATAVLGAVPVATAADVPRTGVVVSPRPSTRHPASSRTTAREARRVDSVPTPALAWYPCNDYAQCATVRLPRDYDEPTGATVEVALLRIRAKDQRHRLGTLFVNPGGPGGSGTQLALQAPFLFSAALRDRFDIVGFDPRGTNASDQVKCFRSPRQQQAALADLAVPFPVTGSEETRYLRGAGALGRACSTTGRSLAASVSTAEVARDMDVLRRAVGDRRLSYLGFSYGSYLGEVYANLFPDRFRALALDGVIDPVAWAGTAATRDDPQTDRLRSADGASRALHEILLRCDRAGADRCSFAQGDPVANFALIARRLKKHPLVDTDPVLGTTFRFGYAELVASTLDHLYAANGYTEIDGQLSDLIILTDPADQSGSATAVRARRLALRSLERRAATTRRGFDFPYDNSRESYTAVACTDSVNPGDPTAWHAAAAAADRRAPYFGRDWTWTSAPCAGRTWTARDEDAYRGPFNRRTAAPVLVVGSRWDPATTYASAVKVAALLPNSRLLRSDNWGHTAFGTSPCATDGIERYLLRGTLPAQGTRCIGDEQPFGSSADRGAPAMQRAVVPLTPAGSAWR